MPKVMKGGKVTEYPYTQSGEAAAAEAVRAGGKMVGKKKPKAKRRK